MLKHGHWHLPLTNGARTDIAWLRQNSPVVRLPFKNCTDIRPWTPTKNDQIDVQGDVLAVVSTLVIEMKQHNTIAPYIFKKVYLPHAPIHTTRKPTRSLTRPTGEARVPLRAQLRGAPRHYAQPHAALPVRIPPRLRGQGEYGSQYP